MPITKRYTRLGVEYTHPTGIKTLSTPADIRIKKDEIIARMKKDASELDDLSRDEIGITNARE
jgi:hypothetical protein